MDDDDLMLMDDSADDLSDRELNRLRNVHSKAGYRDGISDGQESMLQTGFNDGFLEASDKYRQSSKLRGCISAMMIFFKSSHYASDKLLEDLESFLGELKERELKQPEINETNVEEFARMGEDKVTKDITVGAGNSDEIEMLVDRFSLKETDDMTSVEQSTKQHDSSLYNNAENIDHRDNDTKAMISNCHCQSKDNHQMQQCKAKSGKRVRLKYSFDIKRGLEQLEHLLTTHDIPGSVLEKVRASISAVR